MIRIAISVEAFDAIARTMPLVRLGACPQHEGPARRVVGGRDGGPAHGDARTGRDLQRHHSQAGRDRGRMRTLIAAVAVLTCPVWQGIRTCSGPDGDVSHESTRMGVTTGGDSEGDRWSSSRWLGVETTTVVTSLER